MEIVFELFNQLTDPDWIMQKGGLYLVLLILFIETGLFFGFFLPGDPLLFISGMIIAGADQVAHPFSNAIVNLLFWELLFISSAIFGNIVAYWFGKKFSHTIVNRKKESWFLKQKHINAAQQFYEKRGGFAITIARFLPVARTFVPIIGGVLKMDYRRFMFFNGLGAVVWVGFLTTLGFVLGNNPWVNENLEWTILGIIVLATSPVLIKMILPKRLKKSTNTSL